MIGSIVLTIALAFSILAMIMYYLNFRGYTNTLNYGRIAYHAMTMLVIAASVLLLYAILTHQYEYKYIQGYSNNALPTGYLIASFWGGQEGSFMLWLLLTSIIGVVLQSYTSKRGDLEPRVMAVFALATTFLLIMVSPWFKNPFELIWTTPVFLELKNLNPEYFNLPFIQSFFFSDPGTNQGFIRIDSELVQLLAGSGVSVNEFIIDGRGLNPQLLNFWMQIHPPILFLGFSMATVPFVFAIAALLKNNYIHWIKQSFPWLLAGMGVLGLGIMLGGYWAYEMLGWGGYWAWDPVENSSLIPWLVGIAAIHTMLCILTYVLVLYSTFLTRSGVLGDASVHSFVDPGMFVYLFLVIFIGSFILLGFGMIAYRWKTLNENIPEEESLISRELALFTAAIILIASSIIVLVGTSAPIFGQSVDTFFYNEMHLPLGIIIMLLNGLSLLIKWRHSNASEVLKKVTYSGVASILFIIILTIFGGVNDIMILLLALTSAFAFFVNLDIAVKIIKGNKKMLGAYVSHIGIALFILGVIGSAVSPDVVDIDLVKDQKTEAFGYELTFTGSAPIENTTKFAFNIDIVKGGSEYSIAPVMYRSDFNNSLMRQPAILTLFTQDLYISPLGYDPGTQSSSTTSGEIVTLKKGGSTNFSGTSITFSEFDLSAETMQAMQEGKDFQMGAVFHIDKNGKHYDAALYRKFAGGQVEFTSYSSDELNLKIDLVELTAENVKIVFSTLDGSNDQVSDNTTIGNREVLSVTASIKPFISLVWIGVLVVTLGFFVAVARRIPESKISS
jgi:cytochrome c-type biogenesis protein CcmF